MVINEERSKGNKGRNGGLERLLTRKRRWSGTFAAGLGRWWRTVRGSCGWSSRSRASCTPLVDTRTWSRLRDGSRTGRHSCTRRAHSGLMMHSAHSVHLREKKRRNYCNTVSDMWCSCCMYFSVICVFMFYFQLWLTPALVWIGPIFKPSWLKKCVWSIKLKT